MRRCRINLPNRCCHLISRVAHRAYFLDEDERTRLVDFVRPVAEFSGVKLLAFSVEPAPGLLNRLSGMLGWCAGLMVVLSIIDSFMEFDIEEKTL